MPPSDSRRAVQRLVDEEAVVAHAAAGAEHGVPDVAGAFLAVGAVELDLVAHAGQQIRIQRVDRVDRVALGRRRQRVVDRPDRPLAVVRRAAAGVVDRRGLVVDVRAARGRAPLPAVLADLARAAEVVQVHEPLRQRVEVGRDRLRELGDARVAVAALDVAEDLVVRAVLFHDVDHVVDAVVQRLHHLVLGGGRRADEAVVVGDDVGQARQLARVGRRQRQEASLGQLPDVTVARAVLQRGGAAGRERVGRRGAGAVAGVGAGVALAVHHVQRLAVAADAHRVREPAGRDQAEHAAVPVVIAIAGAVEVDHRHRVAAAVGDVERALVGRQRQAVRAAAGRQVAVRNQARGRRGLDRVDDLVAARVDDVDQVGVVGGDQQARLRAVQDHLVGVALHLDARHHARRALDVDDHDLTVADARHVRGRLALDRDAERELAARHAGLRGIDLAGAQIQLGGLGVAGDVDDADRVVLEVGDDQLGAVAGDADARRLRVHRAAEAGDVDEQAVACAAVAQVDRRAALGPATAARGDRCARCRPCRR